MTLKNKKRFIIFVVAVLLIIATVIFAFNFTSENSTNDQTTSQTTNDVSVPDQQEIEKLSENVVKIEPQGTLGNEEYVEKILSEMTLDEKIYQMMFVTPESITGVGQVIQAGKGTATALQNHPVGGIIYFSQNIQDREQISKMISTTQSFSKIPLFIGVDEEGGLVSRLGNATGKKHPSMSDIGKTNDPQKAYDLGTELAGDLSGLGFNVDFAPVADVLVNPNNTAIGSRSFGSDPQLVSNMVAQEVKGLQDNNISATLKHFPGHGSTTTDTHDGYSEITRTMDELRSCEFLPFKAGIDVGVDFIMVAHVTAVNATTDNLPATLSKELITNCLKGELGYNGLVITDSCEMGAITQNLSVAETAIKAVDAGVDMILMPKNVTEAHDALKDAVEKGTISEDRINESVRKILSTKLKRNILNVGQ